MPPEPTAAGTARITAARPGLPPSWRHWAAGVVGLVLFAATTLDVATHGPLRTWVDQTQPPRPHGIPEPGEWRVLVEVGGASVLCVVLVAAAVLQLSLRRRVRPVMVAGVAIVLTECTIWLTKTIVGRTPPASGTDHLRAGGMSYPSGHAADAFALLTIAAALAATPGSRIDRILSWVIPALAGGVAIATVQLHYHWPTDALAGWALGLTAATLARHAIRTAHTSGGARGAPGRPRPPSHPATGGTA